MRETIRLNIMFAIGRNIPILLGTDRMNEAKGSRMNLKWLLPEKIYREMAYISFPHNGTVISVKSTEYDKYGPFDDVYRIKLIIDVVFTGSALEELLARKSNFIADYSIPIEQVASYILPTYLGDKTILVEDVYTSVAEDEMTIAGNVIEEIDNWEKVIHVCAKDYIYGKN